MAFSMDFFNRKTASPAETESSAATSPEAAPQKQDTRTKAPLSTRLAGEADLYVADLKPYLPLELVGGALPLVIGMEEESVWNAASQACATEKVHYVFSVDEGKVWYLACPSAALSSSPDSWCPLAAALPGNSEYWDRETVYMYEQEGIASALRWDQETGRMQVFLGASRTILPRIQSMDANFVTINPSMAKKVPWRNRQLMTEKLSRATARMLLLSGIGLCSIILAVMALQFIRVSFTERQLSSVAEQSENASMDLMMKAGQAAQSDVVKHVARIQQLLDDLGKIDGTLVKYEVKPGGVLEWEALVPAAYSTGIMSVRGQAQPGIEPDGRIRIKGTS